MGSEMCIRDRGYARLLTGGVFSNFNCSLAIHENQTFNSFGECSTLSEIVELNTTVETFTNGDVDYVGHFLIYDTNQDPGMVAMISYLTFTKPVTPGMLSIPVRTFPLIKEYFLMCSY